MLFLRVYNEGEKGQRGEAGEKGKRGLIGFIGYKGEPGWVYNYIFSKGLIPEKLITLFIVCSLLF